MKREILAWYCRLSTHDYPEYVEYAFGVKDNKMYKKANPSAFVAFIFYLEDQNIWYETSAYSLVNTESGQIKCIETYLDEAIDTSRTIYAEYNENRIEFTTDELADLEEKLNQPEHLRNADNIANIINNMYDNLNSEVELFVQICEIRKSLLSTISGHLFEYFVNTRKMIEYIEREYS